MTVTNPRYALPNKHHDIVEDINNLRTTLRTVDSDIHRIEEAIPTLSNRVPEVQNTVLCIESNLANSEIQNIEPNRYLVVNRNGDGFECVESGGEPGGKTGQCCIKRSDKNVDTTWGDILNVSKNGMTVQENAEVSSKNETHIFADETEIENDDQLPKVELTNCQIKSDLESESNVAVIVRDEIEKIEEKGIEIATNQNYGLVKVGNGFTDDNGTISVPVISNATENSAGIIKTNNGLNNENGVISRADLDPATFSSFGVIKLGNGLSINENDEMETSDMSGATIYDLGRVKICNNGIIELEESTLRYRLFVTENILVQIKADFYVRDDFSFVLEIVSDGSHLVVFNENLVPKMTELPVNRGITRMMFTKKMGAPYYEATIYQHSAPEPVNLTPVGSPDINSEFAITSPQGGNWDPWLILKTALNGYSDIRELQFDFETLVCVDYVNYLSRSSSAAMGEFILKGSNDGKNWSTLLYRNGEVVYGKVYTDVKGCFRHYNLKIGYTSDDNKPGGVTLWGTQIDNNESELTALTPLMSSNITSFATFTASKFVSNSAAQATDNDLSTFVTIGYDANQNRWAQYELETPAVANVLELGFCNTNTQTNWFMLTGSNDGENWTLLLERQYPTNTLFNNNYRVMIYNFQNETTYKYYRLNCIATNDTAEDWRIYEFKLYRRDIGKHNFHNLVPVLTSATQDGYEVTASSQYDGGHAPVYAFDGSSSTKWASSGTGTQWLQIKLPTATVCNVIKIVSRSDGYSDQAPKNFEIRGSDDTETWTTLTTQTGVTWSIGQSQSFSFENETAYQYYRLVITANNGGGDYSLGEFVIGKNSYEYKRYLDKYDNVVPTMTSDETIGEDGIYRLSSSTEHSDHKRKYLFDKRFDTQFELSGQTSGWIQVELPVAKFINVFSVGARSDRWCVAAPRNYTLLGSNDETTWTELFSVSNSTTFSGSELRTHELTHNESYKFYRLNISNPDSSVLTFARWDLIIKEQIQEY